MKCVEFDAKQYCYLAFPFPPHFLHFYCLKLFLLACLLYAGNVVIFFILKTIIFDRV